MCCEFGSVVDHYSMAFLIWIRIWTMDPGGYLIKKQLQKVIIKQTEIRKNRLRIRNTAARNVCVFGWF